MSATTMLQTKIMGYYVHPTAVIEEGCHIGQDTSIWHFSHLRKGCRIGANCTLGQNVFIDCGVEIGNYVKVQNNVSLHTGIICEDYVFLGPSSVFTNVINPRSALERKDQFKKTIIRKGATVGANATLVCGIEIGEYAFIGAGSVVVKTVQPYSLIVGNPAKHIGWVSMAGIRLKFDNKGEAVCKEGGEAYKLENNQVFKMTI